MSRGATGRSSRGRRLLLALLPVAVALGGCESFRPEWVEVWESGGSTN